MLVAEVLGSQRPCALPPTATVRAAAQMMQDNDIGDVLVADEDKTLRGIVTDRDIVVRAIAEGRNPEECTLGDICTRELVTVDADASTDEAQELMRKHAVRRLPVVREGQKLEGVLSLGDLAETLDEKSTLADISEAPANN